MVLGGSWRFLVVLDGIVVPGDLWCFFLVLVGFFVILFWGFFVVLNGS